MTKETGPWLPTPWSPDDAYAVKALAAGMANESQQKRALEWVLHVCGLRDLSYRPDSARDTDFAEGKRFVGLQIAKLMTISAGAIEATRTRALRGKQSTTE